MRLLVCGSRDWTDRAYLFGVLDGIHASQDVTVVIEGQAPGADRLARDWAEGHRIVVIPFPAKWDEQGRSAGIRRNEAMLTHGKPELVVAFWDGKSRGTSDMIGRARAAEIECWIFTGPKAHGAAVPSTESKASA